MRDERILDYNFVMNPFQETFKIFVEKNTWLQKLYGYRGSSLLL